MSTRQDAAVEFARLLDEDAEGTADLALVGLLREAGAALAPQTVLSEATRAAQRQRLMAVAHVQAVQAAAPAAPAAAESTGLLAGLRRFSAGLQATRRTVAVAGTMASVVAVLGVGVAASHSLPGDPFYGVKRTTEAAQLKLRTSDQARGELHLAIARTRLNEVESLSTGDGWALGVASTGPSGLGALGGSTAALIRKTLDAMDEQTQQGVNTLTAVAQAKKDPEPLRTIAAFAASQRTRLSALLPTLPASSREQASASLALVQEVKDESDQLLKGAFCTDSCNPAEAAPTVVATTPPVPGPSATKTSTVPPVPPCSCPPVSPEAQPTTSDPSPSPTPTVTPTQPQTPVVVPTKPPVLNPPPITIPPITIPPITIPPIIVLPTEIVLPSLPGLPLPTSIPLPDLQLPTIPPLPPVLGR